MQPLQGTVWRFLKTLKIEWLYDPAIPLLSIQLPQIKTLIWKDTCTPIFTAALFTIVKVWKPSQAKGPSPDEWLEKMWCVRVYIHTMEYYSAIKKNGTLPRATTWTDSQLRTDLCQVKQVRQKQTNTVWHHLYVKSKNKSQITPSAGENVGKQEPTGTAGTRVHC